MINAVKSSTADQPKHPHSKLCGLKTPLCWLVVFSIPDISLLGFSSHLPSALSIHLQSIPFFSIGRVCRMSPATHLFLLKPFSMFWNWQSSLPAFTFLDSMPTWFFLSISLTYSIVYNFPSHINNLQVLSPFATQLCYLLFPHNVANSFTLSSFPISAPGHNPFVLLTTLKNSLTI